MPDEITKPKPQRLCKRRFEYEQLRISGLSMRECAKALGVPDGSLACQAKRWHDSDEKVKAAAKLIERSQVKQCLNNETFENNEPLDGATAINNDEGLNAVTAPLAWSPREEIEAARKSALRTLAAAARPGSKFTTAQIGAAKEILHHAESWFKENAGEEHSPFDRMTDSELCQRVIDLGRDVLGSEALRDWMTRVLDTGSSALQAPVIQASVSAGA